MVKVQKSTWQEGLEGGRVGKVDKQVLSKTDKADRI